jgi:hypothetical protein
LIAVAPWPLVGDPGALPGDRGTATGDERDDAVLTRALAVLGLIAFPLTGVTAIAVGLGAAAQMMLTLLLLAEIAVGAVAFAVINRRSWALSAIRPGTHLGGWLASRRGNGPATATPGTSRVRLHATGCCRHDDWRPARGVGRSS